MELEPVVEALRIVAVVHNLVEVAAFLMVRELVGRRIRIASME